jgi:hypothetical protein
MHSTFRVLASASALSLIVACTPQDVQEAETETRTMTFEELMELDGDFMCTFMHIDTDTTTTGTVYITADEENLRGDFQIIGGDVSAAHIIHVDDMTYIWSPDQGEGIMMQIDQEDSIFGNDESDEQMGIAEDEPIDFECAEWDADPSFFEPPADVNFTDFGSMMQGMMEGMGMTGGDGSAMGMDAGMDVKAMQCAACANISDAAAKAECQAAVGC